MPAETSAAAAPVFAFSQTRAWTRRQTLVLAITAALMLLVFENTDLDRQLAGSFFDPELGLFPLRRDWLLETVMHKGARLVSQILVAASLLVCWHGWKGRLAWLPPRNALLAAIGMLAIPAATAALKLLTNRHCPWDIADFGGYAPYLRLLEMTPPGVRSGRCFPAGHASAGFLWIVWAVALRPAGMGAARLALLVGLIAGGLLGATQMARGAHFLSHTLWTLWLAWALTVPLAIAVRAEISPGGGASSSRRAQRPSS